MTFRYARLLALVALVMLVASGPAFAQTDYDTDGDNYIDVANLAQLNAIRYDLNGDGVVANTDTANYNAAFPNAATGMGCAVTCTGYELTANLDFDENGDGQITQAGDPTYWNSNEGWQPIGTDTNAPTRYQGDFKGNGYTIDNLFINRTIDDVGLFGSIHSTSRIESLGVTNANVTARQFVGILTGTSYGDIVACYTTGAVVSSYRSIGGLVGYLETPTSQTGIHSSYSTASVRVETTQGGYAGGLVGRMHSGYIRNSYATGAVSGVTSQFVVGLGGLVGSVSFFGASNSFATNSYWDTQTTGQSSSARGTGKTTSALQSITTYTGIYATWNGDVDGDSVPDNPWNFGTASEYPTLYTPSERIQISISSESVDEGATGTTPLRFTVSLFPARPSPVTVAYADAGTGSATSGTDYTALAGGVLTFAAGETSKTINVSVIGDAFSVIGDAAIEPDETVVVTLSSPVNAVLVVASATGTITNDDDREPTFGEVVDPQSYRQNRAIEPLTLPAATGGDGGLTYSLTELPEGLSFDAETLTVSGTPTKATEKALYTLTATDADGDEAGLSFFLTIVANMAPSFGDTSVVAQTYLRKQEIKSLTLPQATGGDEPLTYALTSALPEGLNFNAETRVLSGTPLEAIAETTYTLTVTDSDGDEATLMFTIEVMTDPMPTFGDTIVAAQVYLQHREIDPLTLPQASSGDEPLTYALAPALPEGLTFDAETRIVSGTPIKAMDETTYTLTATDGNGDEARLMFTLEIPDLVPAFGDTTTIAAQGYLVNQEIASLTFPQATGGDGMLIYILLPFLPDGLNFDPTTRTLSGLPSEAKAQATYTMSALDADGDVASLPFTLEVSLPSPDFNGDGNVNFADFLIFASKYGSRFGQERYDPRCDLNGNGEIDIDDFHIFVDSFGSTG